MVGRWLVYDSAACNSCNYDRAINVHNRLNQHVNWYSWLVLLIHSIGNSAALTLKLSLAIDENCHSIMVGAALYTDKYHGWVMEGQPLVKRTASYIQLLFIFYWVYSYVNHSESWANKIIANHNLNIGL